MVPLVASNAIPTPPPVINTMLPGATITHVPYDNVAPSVSNAEVNNNASNNNTPPPAPEAEQAGSVSVEEAIASYLSGTAAPIPNVSAQATFLAQLIGQDINVPPETAGILVQYEKLNAYANVKYKPSNATKPEDPGPSGAFARILVEDHAGPAALASPAPVEAPVKAPVTIQIAQIPAAPAAKPLSSRSEKGSNAYVASAGRISANSNAVVELA